MKRSVVLGVGHYVPPRVVTNKDLEKLMDTSDEWIQQRTGIQERRYVEKGMGNTEMSYEATRSALKRANLEPDKIEMIILGTLSPDYVFPGDACFLQEKLGLSGIPALDIRQQCSGFTYGITIADQFIRNGMYKTILVVGTEVHSSGLDFSTRGRDVTIIFGDGAGAMILGCEEGNSHALSRGILSTHIHADGKYAKELWVECPSSRQQPNRITNDMIEDGRIYPKMNGRAVFVMAVKKFQEVIKEALDKNHMSAGDVNLFIFHQANLRIVQAVSEAMNIPMEKTYNNIQRYGNTTAASIPIALSEAYQDGKISSGTTVCLASFGSGFTWGSVLLKW